MRKPMDMRKLKVAMAISLVLMASIGLSAANILPGKVTGDIRGYVGDVKKEQADYGSYYYDSYLQGIELHANTVGNGFASNYMYQKMGDFSAFNFGHGSGSIDSDVIFLGAEKTNQSHPAGWDWRDTTTWMIKVAEDTSLVYAPITFPVGTGYYREKPLEFDSLIKERTWMKDYSDLYLVENEVEYAHALDKELNIDMLSCTNYTYDPVTIEFGPINFSVIQDVTQGRTHFGVLQGETESLGPGNIKFSGSAFPPIWAAYKSKYNAVTIDENYWGTYHIERKTKSEAPSYEYQYYDNWLPCCYGGYETMPPMYQYGPKGFGDDVRPFFDCTCYKAPYVAQFPRVY